MNKILSNLLVHHPMNWKRFQMYRFAPLSGKISFIALVFIWGWNSSSPIKRLEWKLHTWGSQEFQLSVAHDVTWTLPRGLLASQFQAFWSSGLGLILLPDWLFLGTGTKSTFGTWKQNTDSAQCSLCVCMSVFVYAVHIYMQISAYMRITQNGDGRYHCLIVISIIL